MNGRNGLIRVVDKVRIVEDGPRDGDAQLVIVGRRRQNFEVVLELRDALDVGQETADIFLLVRLADLAADDQLVTLSLEHDIVKNRVKGIRDNLFPRLLRDLARRHVLRVDGDMVHNLIHVLDFASRVFRIELDAQTIHGSRKRRHAVLVTDLNLPVLENVGMIDVVLNLRHNLRCRDVVLSRKACFPDEN